MRLARHRPTARDRAELQASAEAQLAAVALKIRDDARQLAPRESGRLAAAIEVERVTGPRGVEYVVGWSARGFYGPMVEFGTEDTPPRPHLVPAAVKSGAVAPIGGGA